jgi:hypothetical protein
VLVFGVAIGIIAMCYGDGKNSKFLKGYSLKACKYLWDDKEVTKKQ